MSWQLIAKLPAIISVNTQMLCHDRGGGTGRERKEIPGTRQAVDQLFRAVVDGSVEIGGVTVHWGLLRTMPAVMTANSTIWMRWHEARVDVKFSRTSAMLRLPAPEDMSGSIQIEFPVQIPEQEFIVLSKLLAGEVVQIDDQTTLTLPASAPLPQLIVSSPHRIRASWQPPARLTRGGVTAELRGIDIYREFGELDIEWRLLGIDLARNQLIWWA